MSADMANKKGDDLMAQAQKKLNSWSIFSGGSKHSDAAELYRLAGAQFKISKNWVSAGEAFANAASCFLKANDRSDAVASFGEAGRAYANVDGAKAISYLEKAGTMQMEDNRFSAASKFFSDMGEIFAGKLNLPEKAIEAYRIAADCYYNTNSKTTAHSYLVKACDLYVEVQRYDEAIELWEKICSETPEALSSRIEDYCFKALLVGFMLEAKKNAGALSKSTQKIAEYCDKFPRIEDSPKIKLLNDLIVAFDEMNEMNFTDTLHKYDRIYKIDNFSASILYEIKKALVDGANKAALIDGADDASEFC